MNESGSRAGSALRPPLPDHVVFVSLDEGDLPDHPLLPEEEALLHPRAVERYRAAFRLGRGAARTALKRLGLPETPILRGAHREPLWPEGVVGAITHTAGRAMAAVALAGTCGGIGLDLERIAPVRDISSRIAGEEERAWLAGAPPGLRTRYTLQLFSAKESVFKAFFPRIGEYFGFHHARLRWNEEHARFVGDLLPPYDDVPGSRGFTVHCRWREELVLTSMVLPA